MTQLDVKQLHIDRGTIHVLLTLCQPLPPTYALHITDYIPISLVVLTSMLIDRAYIGRCHLADLPNAVILGSPYARMDDATIPLLFCVYLQQMFADRTEDLITALQIEPICLVGKADTILLIDTDRIGLYLVNSAQNNQLLAGNDAVVAHTPRASERIIRPPVSLQPPLARCASA